MSLEDFDIYRKESDLQIDVELADVFLQRVRIDAAIQRFQTRPPMLEDLAERRSEDIRFLEAEVHFLRADNARLAHQPDAELLDCAVSAACDNSTGFLGTASGASTTPVRPRRARSALEELTDELSSLRTQQFCHQRRSHWTQVHEEQLIECRVEAQQIVRQLRVQTRRLEDAKRKRAMADAGHGDLQQLVAQGRRGIDEEEATIRELNREVAALREACYVPARLRRESGFFIKALDQCADQRLAVKRQQRAVDSCSQLYDRVSEEVPALVALAGRVRTDAASQFARYLQLEEAHARALRKLHVAVTRDVFATAAGGGGNLQRSLPAGLNRASGVRGRWRCGRSVGST